MPSGPPAFSVPAETITRLGRSFTPFVNQLLEAEAAVAGLDGVNLTTTFKENLGDEGVDAGLRRATATTWIPAGESAWQFKAGNLGPKESADELAGADAALEVLRAGGKYRLVLGEALNATLVKRRRTRLIEKAIELGIQVDPESDMIEVLDANHLARWVQTHPYLAISQLLGGVGTAVINFDSWSDSIRLQEQWIASPPRDQLRESVHQFVSGYEQVDLRIEGVSGLGKTRGLLEAFRDTEMSSLVVYVRAADGFPDELAFRLLRQDRRLVVVVDDCGRKRHEQLASFLHIGTPVRLITVGEREEVDVRVPGIQLQRLDDEVLDEILKANQPSLSTEARRVVVGHCAGNVRWALRLAAGIEAQNPDSASELLTPEAIQTYVTNALPGDGDFLACSALALLTRVGYDAEVTAELDYLADLLGFRSTELRAAARVLSKEGLLDRQGRYRSVAPHPLAVYLAGVAWDEFGDKLVDSLSSMPADMSERLLRRAADVGTSAATSTAVERILASGGPFSSLAELHRGSNSRLLTQAAIISPDQVTAHLSRLLRHASREELLAATAVRRNLVWTLEKLVWHTRTFEEAADCLMLLALAENETFANNATGTWVELFGTQLPGTAARPAQRMGYLRVTANRDAADVRRLAARACGQALSTHESIMISGEDQGGMFVEPRGRPTTWDEVWEYQRDAMRLARVLVDDSDSDVAGKALEVLTSSIHPFLEVEPVRDTLFEVLASLPAEGLAAVWTHVNELSGLFDRVDSDVADRVAGLDVLVSALPPQTPLDELSALGRLHTWALENDQLLTKVLEACERLGREDSVATLLAMLSDPELPAAFEVGRALYSLANSEQTLSEITRVVADGGSIAALTAYLYGAIQAGEETSFDDYIESSSSNPLSDTLKLSLSVRGPRTERAWTRVTSLLPDFEVREGVARMFGWHVDLEEKQIRTLLDLWTPRIESQADYNACVDFIAMALHRRPDPLPEVESSVADLVARLREFPKVGQQSWDWARLAERQLTTDPIGLLRLLLDLIEEGASIVHGIGEEDPVFAAAIERVGPQALTPILDRVEAGSWRLQMDLRGWVLNQFPSEAIETWVSGSPERAEVVASLATVPESGPPDDTLRFLLKRFASNDKVASSLMGEYISGTWWGNESDRLSGQIDHMRSWIDSDESDELRSWAKRVRESLEDRRKKVLLEEAEETF